jgi:lycopene beta-cyclase
VHDVLVVGGGPAGRAVAAACGEHGLRTVVLDPAPNRPWTPTYGMWSDEVPADLPGDVVGVRVQGVAIARTRHRLRREYAVLDTAALRAHLDARLAAADVQVIRGRAVPGSLPRARLVIDAGGTGQPLSLRRTRRVAAEQTAFGLVVPADVAAPVVGIGEALFMDWRPVPGVAGWPTFLYAVPLADGRVLLEETSLARRPGLPIRELAQRLRARLAGHGVAVPGDAEREVVCFRLDVPRHRAPGVLGFGAAAPLTHPATGYQMATALRAAPVVAAAVAGHWAGGPDAALAAAQSALWPAAARATHLLRRRGLESLLRMPPERVPDFFEGFFALPVNARDAYLDGRSRPVATIEAMARLFRTTPWPVRLRLIGSSLLLSAPPRYGERSNGE